MKRRQRAEVVIDPGHGGARAYGGSSPGGVEPERGVAEKDVNLDLARRVAARLGSRALLTRDRDVNVSLAERSRIAADGGARALVSIHANSGGQGVHGSEVWLHDRHNRASVDLGQSIYAELGRVGPTRGMYQGPLTVLDPGATGGAAACLIETDYLTDPAGRRRLTNGADLEALADAISAGVNRYLARTGDEGTYGRVRAYGNQSFDYAVSGEIPTIRQPTGMSCWATVTTMLMSWRDGQTWDIEQAMDSIATEWGDLFRLSRSGGRRGGLLGRDKPRFLAAAGLEAEAAVNFDGVGWMDLMQRYGPLWVTGDVDASESWAIHARILYSVRGDGSRDGTWVGLIDPATGRASDDLTLGEFMDQFEAEAADPDRPLRVQIVHWPAAVAERVTGQGYGGRRGGRRSRYGRTLQGRDRSRGRSRSHSHYGDGYFTDAEELADSLRDQRATDHERVSAVSSAQALVDAYLARGATTVWPGINARTAAQQIRDRCQDHRLFQQGNLSLCGPAAFLMVWAGRDPVGYAQYALSLLETGQGSIGSNVVTASESMLALNYPRLGNPYGGPTTMSTPEADFVAMAALRNDANMILPYDGRAAMEPASGGTFPDELAGWMRDTGVWSSVRDEASWARSRGFDHAMNLLQAEGVDNIILINVNALANAARVEEPGGSAGSRVPPDKSFLLNQFPNHFIVMLSEIIPDYTNDARTLSISAWTWAGSYVFEGVPTSEFMENYYGAVIGTVRR